MPLRPRSLIDQSRPDNTQQVTQEPGVISKEVAAVANDQEWQTGIAAPITSNIYEGVYKQVLSGTGLSGSYKDVPAYAFGTGQGDVLVVKKDDGSQIGQTTSVSSDPIVSVGFTSITGEESDVLALSEDGSLYSVAVGSGVSNWSYAVGGTPTADIEPDDSNSQVYVGQPSGQSGELYAIGYGAGTPNWTYTGSGGYNGGIAYDPDSDSVFAGPGGDLVRVDASNGSEDWAVSPGGGSETVRGKIGVGSDTVFAAMTTERFTSHTLAALDKSNGSTEWTQNQFSGLNKSKGRASVVLDSDHVYHYPTAGGEFVARRRSDGIEAWRYDDVAPLSPTSNDSPTEVAVKGNSVYISAGVEAPDPPGDVIELDTATGDQLDTFDTGTDVEKALVTDDVYLAFSSVDGDARRYNVANNSLTSLIEVGSRPFLTIGAQSNGAFEVEVYGIPDPDKFEQFESNQPYFFKQETLSFSGDEPTAKQLPWWSWRFVGMIINDPNATAGDVTLFVSASR